MFSDFQNSGRWTKSRIPVILIILLYVPRISSTHTIIAILLQIASPACTELEVVMMDWLGKMLDLPKEFLASTGGKGGGVIQVSPELRMMSVHMGILSESETLYLFRLSYC
jgi:hypothetical protein